MTRRFNAFIVLMIFLIGLPVYWLFFENSTGNAKAEPVTVANLRKIAASMEGPLPDSIEYERIAGRYLQRNRYAAGTGFKPTKQQAVSYRIVYPDGTSIIIDTGMTERQARKAKFGDFDAAAQNRVFEAMAQASQIVTLASGHPHDGGIRSIETWRKKKPDGAVIAGEAGERTDTGPYAIAPGVVLIAATKLGNDARLVYVNTSDGAEFLFAGAVSNIDLNWKDIRAPARFETDFGERKDRKAIHSWLMAVRNLADAAPRLEVVSLNAPPPKTRMHDGFSIVKSEE